ncbi:MAG: uridine diphosphate-N-acetylglucosamine-binding protein YvcK [Nitrospiraceae bacterium]|nr:uridine diphosphate-N-acetylglucosamine-binding protein YvcK [Nitrospiraceae bacterium]
MEVTTIGGGTGSFHLLVALKEIENIKINAIVSVSDNGGSTGILRTLYGILPPGDIRNCLVALSNDTKTWTKLFNYRFDEKLNKHSLGNLILTALTGITGSEEEGIKVAHEILGIKTHKVIPVTYNKTQLGTELENGVIIKGETELRKKKGNEKIKRMFLESDSRIYPNPEALRAILNSDIIFISPGSLYSSIVPNFLVPEIKNAINRSKAKKIYIVNIMTEPGETDNFNVTDFVNVIEGYINLDYVIVNTKKPSQVLLDKYKKEGKTFVEFEDINKNDTKFVKADLLNEKDILRHDPVKLRRIIEYLMIKEVELNKGK